MSILCVSMCIGVILSIRFASAGIDYSVSIRSVYMCILCLFVDVSTCIGVICIHSFCISRSSRGN